MYQYLLQGLLLGLAYVAPIGMQNLYVINTAMNGDILKTYQVMITTIIFDVSLALACFFGVGLLIQKFYFLRSIILLVGSILVVYIGITLILNSSREENNAEANDSIVKIIITCFVVTWLNPQALIDGSLLLGGYHTSVPAHMAKYFIVGFCSASIIWFMFIANLVLILRDKLRVPVIKRINIICGVILIYFGARLGYSYIQGVY